MSIKVMSNIWDQSKHKNGALLLLLSLADHANDDGVCYPSVGRLAKRSRRSLRHTKRLLSILEDSGELYRQKNSGRGRTNLYLVTVGFSAEELLATLIRRFGLSPTDAEEALERLLACQKGDADVTISGPERVTFQDRKGDILDEKVTPVSRKGDASVTQTINNHHENRIESSSENAAAPKPEDTRLVDTPEAREMFARLGANAKAIGRRGPKQFPSLECKRKFLDAVVRLDSKFDYALNKALESGLTSVTRVVNYIASPKWQQSDSRKASYGPSTRAPSPPPAPPPDLAQVERDRAALRAHRARQQREAAIDAG